MEVIRLLPGDDRSWPLMPEFLRRVQKFVERYLPETNAYAIQEDLKQRWIKEPFLTGYFLAFDDGGVPFSHMASYVAQEAFGNPPYVFIYQAYCDKYSKLGKVAELGFKQINEWASQLNVAIKEGHKIKKFEFCTWRDVEVWIKYFQKLGYQAVEGRHVIRGDLKLV